jgi:hypothetical protein
VSAAPASPPPPTTRAGGGVCPLCGTPLHPDQEWCLRCGAAARTRLATSSNWRAPIVTIAVVATLSLGVLAAAIVDLAGGFGSTTTPTPTTVTAPPAVVPPTTSATPGTSAPGATAPSPGTPTVTQPSAVIPTTPASPGTANLSPAVRAKLAELENSERNSTSPVVKKFDREAEEHLRSGK